MQYSEGALNYQYFNVRSHLTFEPGLIRNTEGPV